MCSGRELVSQMLRMRESLLEQPSDVRVVELIDLVTTLLLSSYEAEITQNPQVLRDGRLFHAGSVRQLFDRDMPALCKQAQKLNARACGESFHRIRDEVRGFGINCSEVGPVALADRVIFAEKPMRSGACM